jgi:uncharacterized DUF497 family protein
LKSSFQPKGYAAFFIYTLFDRTSFELAATVFRDPLQVSVYDEDHSESEERWVTLGQAENGKLLVVVHTFEETNEGAKVRVISAREATKRERQDYEDGREAR